MPLSPQTGILMTHSCEDIGAIKPSRPPARKLIFSANSFTVVTWRLMLYRLGWSESAKSERRSYGGFQLASSSAYLSA